jgi:hypothetical protein
LLCEVFQDLVLGVLAAIDRALGAAGGDVDGDAVALAHTEAHAHAGAAVGVGAVEGGGVLRGREIDVVGGVEGGVADEEANARTVDGAAAVDNQISAFGAAVNL